MHKYSCKVYIRDDARADGTSLLGLQCFINKHRVRLSLDISVRADNFNKDKECVFYNSKSPLRKDDVNDLNILINKAKAKASDIFVFHRLTDNPLSVEEFKKKYLESGKRHDFLNFFEKEIECQRSFQTPQTINIYRGTLKKLQAFKTEVELRDLTYEFVSEFERFLIKEYKLGINSIWKEHKNIRKFIRLAQKKGFILTNPYESYKLKQVPGQKEHLTKKEVEELIKVYEKKELSPELHSVLKYFLFSCFTSLRISDIKTIEQDQIIENTLVFMPVKTQRIKKLVRIPLTDMAKKFLSRHDGLIFRTISEQKTNKALKKIMEQCDINKNITFHCARHTFAVLFLASGGKVETLQKIMGHSEIVTTMVYVHIADEYVREQISLMDDAFSKPTLIHSQLSQTA
jgi:integrase/recombinase XerD